MLRKVILAYGVLALIAGIGLALAGIRTGLVLYLGINGAIVIAALLFERGRYRPTVKPGGKWAETGERFVDPSTGQLVKVRYNPQTGARDYVGPRTSFRAFSVEQMMRTTILFLLAVIVLVAGAITVVASPKLQSETAFRPTPSPLFVIETTPTPTPTSAPTPTATPAATPSGVVTIAMPVYKQLRGLDCETAALQMALAALGKNYTQNQLIAMQPPPDTRGPIMGPVVNGHKTVSQWGDPYKQFVGNIDGADLIPTGYGVYYPPLLSLVQSHGFPNATAGEGTGNGWTASKIYAAVAAGHPVMAWVETGWMSAYVGYWTTFDGTKRIRYSLIEHVVTLSGVSPTQIRVNDPWKSGSQYWFSKSAFEASWADFNNMAIILQ